MSATAKIIYILLAIFVLGLGVEGFFYYRALQKPKSVFSPTSSGNETPKLIDITGQAIVGNLNLFDINKDQVSQWAKTGGIIEIPAYPGPIPTPQGSLPTSDLPRPTSVKVLAGYFRETQGGGIIVSQGGKGLTLAPNQGSRLWIKTGDKIQIVSTQLDKLLYSGGTSRFIETNDPILILGIIENEDRTELLNLIVFK